MELKARCKERFEPVVQAIRQLQKEKEGLDEPLIVAIDGRCGSGKTTLGEYLEQVFDCNLFRMDDFFLRMEQRTPQRLKETGGNVDYERFEETVLRPIFQKQTVFYQPFSCLWGHGIICSFYCKISDDECISCGGNNGSIKRSS